MQRHRTLCEYGAITNLFFIIYYYYKLSPGGVAGQDRPAVPVDKAHPGGLRGEVRSNVSAVVGSQRTDLCRVLWHD